MDGNQPRDATLLRAALEAALPQGVEWEILDLERGGAGARSDAQIIVRSGARQFRFAVEIKRGLRPQTLGPLLHQLASAEGEPLLVADYITPQMADELRAREVQFIDAAGNAYLRKPGLVVWVKGQRPRSRLDHAERSGRAFRPAGLRVLFTLLCRPEAVDLPYREIAALAGVAVGSVGWVMAELPSLDFMLELKARRQLTDFERLLSDWVTAYAQTLRPRLLLARYQAESLSWTEDIDGTQYGLLLGGEPAANRLTHHLRPGTAVFYGERTSVRLLADQRLRPDGSGNVEVLKRFWTFEGETPGLVPLLLIYADLINTRDARCLEIAKELHAQVVTRPK